VMPTCGEVTCNVDLGYTVEKTKSAQNTQIAQYSVDCRVCTHDGRLYNSYYRLQIIHHHRVGVFSATW